MDAIPPEQPVRHGDRDRPGHNSGWWVVVSVIAAATAGVVAVLVPPSTAAVVVGMTMMAVGAGLVLAGQRRMYRENRGEQLPWLGSPPNSPRRWDCLQGTGGPMLMFGTLPVARTLESVPILALPFGITAAFVVITALTQILHNRGAVGALPERQISGSSPPARRRR
ncbi:hypothetical protein C8K36_10746 [Rhodococcus sp. OK519]|uniref:hypothetical protein n=1 Tax=Rhodococcus sp. OK519 TaxID=2135729 RepID=UPI000D34C954|nr:hypothetical protein C8K36_10746 [Rhodococcus sp. OK519]